MQGCDTEDEVWRCRILHFVRYECAVIQELYPDDSESILLCVKSIQYSGLFPSFAPQEGASIILYRLFCNPTDSRGACTKQGFEKGCLRKKRFHYRNDSGKKSPFLSRHGGHYRRSWGG